MPARRSLIPVLAAVVFALAFGDFCATTSAQRRGQPPPQQQQEERAVPKTLAEAADGLQFRNIGPATMGGRIDAFAVVESNPSTFYVAAASGGLWKTINNGITFEPVFDDQAVSSIGDLAIAPSNPAIIYVGTGEQNNRQSSSWGNGVYRSNDAGKTWRHLGLADTHHIGRIAVDPRNPDVVYVAALGHLWGPNRERGLYKTTDGGKTWVNTKFINEDTGFVDVAMDPQNPHILYAASYQRRRTQFGFNGGGPGSALWKTIDGGTTWTKLTKGLPAGGDIGRIGLAVYPKDPRIVYATIEHAKEDGLYRSDDSGDTWVKTSATNPRPSYYSTPRVDPNNEQRIWVLGAPLYYSEDGGKTFRSDVGQRIHGDYHAIWIDPANSNHMMAGTDGGIHITYDRARSWDYVNTVALAQFYEVSADMRKPYYVYGGLQDNGSWAGPSRTLVTDGITNADWFRVGGGDGFYCVVDPVDHNTVYVESQDGHVSRLNTKTFETRNIRPEPPEGERHRFNWNSPILISPHDHNTVYYGGNRLFGSRDRGDTWTLIAPDLTSNIERDKQTIFGKTAKDMLSRNDGVVHYSTITTIAESPLKAGILWVGTDDGRLQVSRDGGKTWADVVEKVRGVPKGTYVSRVEASRSAEGRAYAAFDGHRNNDFKVYLFRTDDFGQNWRSVSGKIPDGGTVHVVREHPKNSRLLFVGTENGLWASWNDGEEWQRLKSKLPTVPIFDLQIHPRDNDLIVATHGRGVWIMDDIAPLVELAERMNSDLHLFDIGQATQFRVHQRAGNTGHKAFLSPNPPPGASITYWLKAKPGEKDRVSITITDAAGKVVRDLRGLRAQPGLNRTNWDLRHNPPFDPAEAFGGGGGAGSRGAGGSASRGSAAAGGSATAGGQEAGAVSEATEAGQAGGGGRFGGGGGPRVLPGTYTVKLTVGQASATRQVVVEDDPRIEISGADRKVWYDASVKAAWLSGRVMKASRTVATLNGQLTDLQAELKNQPKTPEVVTSAVKALADKMEAMNKRLTRQQSPLLGFAGARLAEETDPLTTLVTGLYGRINSFTAVPTAQERELMDRLSKKVDAVEQEVSALEKEVPALNKLLFDNGIGKLPSGTRGTTP